VGEDLREKVKERYAGVVRAVRSVTGSSSEGVSCCGSSGCGSWALESDMTGGSYSEAEKRGLPRLAADASLGCGNPVALAALSPGEVVLDLGSGGGIDVLLSARRVVPGGKAYGLDMTDEMLDLARKNAKEAGVKNVEFLKGEIEAISLPDEHTDVIISNCVINLSTEKAKAISESFRVLKPGGRFAVSDVVFLGEKVRLPDRVVRSVEAWAGCVSGALEKAEYEALLSAAGFVDVSVEITHVYPPELAPGSRGPEDVEALRSVPIASAFVRARKPVE
jgi:arsenite methyltransferase